METLLAASITINLPDWPTTYIGGITVVLVAAIVTIGYVRVALIRPRRRGKRGRGRRR
jgi:thiamine monophosphate synthase